MMIAGVVVVALVAAAGAVAVLWPQAGKTHVTAHFSRAVGLYKGSEVRILGVKVGRVEQVVPMGTKVQVDFWVDSKYKIPQKANAVLVAASVVADRYVQLTPVYKGGPAMKDNALIPVERTATPVELDDAFSTLNELTAALGPKGANKNGALSRLLEVGADNLKGQGDDVKQTLKGLGAAAGALRGNGTDLKQTVRNLDRLITALKENDARYRQFSKDLTDVSAQLKAEKEELSAALINLNVALKRVVQFIRDNKTDLKRNVEGLAKVTGVLVKQKKAVEEFLDTAPTGLSNAALAYDSASGTLFSRVNVAQTDNIAMWVCSLVHSLGAPPSQCLKLLGPLNALGAPLSRLTTFDLSFLTEATTRFDVVPPPPDAYGATTARNSPVREGTSFGGAEDTTSANKPGLSGLMQPTG